VTDEQAVAVGAVQPSGGEAGSGVRSPITVFDIEGLDFFYGRAQALRDVTLRINRHEITALIGPSGCGKTTFLRCLNRMNDLIPGTRVGGRLDFDGQPLYGSSVRAIDVRRRIGMVFQKANPFPKSIYDNIAIAPKVNGIGGNLDDLVEESLTRAALWDEVKDKLKHNAFSLSGGQQQRLCIARSLAVAPKVLLMDEPCSALDPTSTRRVEDTIAELQSQVTIVIVTHNMQQAQRVSQKCAFFLATDKTPGHIVESGPTQQLFDEPNDPRTADYVNGRFG
jgi:phosphate transport system ATP-binding protein